MRWIVWGWRVVDGEPEPLILGEVECETLALTALVLARRKFGDLAVDRVQSALSHEIDLLETVEKLVLRGHRPRPYRRRKPKKKSSTTKGGTHELARESKT